MQNSNGHIWHLASSSEMHRLGKEWRECPRCGKLEYKPYVDASGEPLARECGRCNREINCQYHLPPKEYLVANPCAHRDHVSVLPVKPKKPIIMPTSWVTKKRKDNKKNILLSYLRNLSWNNEQRERLEVALVAYGIGTDKLGRTIFWQIDENLKIRSGKQIAYKSNGHREKSKPPSWIHTAVKALYPDDEFEYVGCFFGQHLAHAFKSSLICLVESEKTALICSAFWPMNERLFIATGGLRNVSLSRFSYFLKNKRKIVAYPDHDGFEVWTNVLKEISPEIKISDFVEKNFKKGVDPETADIADILLRLLAELPNPDVLTSEQKFEIMKINHPHFGEFTKCLDLKLIK